jgi:S-adenosylmethionine:tRNA ribosyltransferase-isomerase
VSAPALEFELPEALEAVRPPEARGLERDEVRLLVATRGDLGIEHAAFRDLPDFFAAGDLLVINNSATLAAAIGARHEDGAELEVHFATAAPHLSDGWWVVELRSAGGVAPFERTRAGEHLALDGGAELEVVAPYAGGERPRLWVARFEGPEPAIDHLARCGRPIRYDYVPEAWPLDAYQTAFALAPGSAEMPSAGRPFTPRLITRLIAGGVLITQLTLHAGVSSPERDEAPFPERFVVPETTARLVNAVRRWGGRVIAVGTTVVRALETVAAPDGIVRAGDGWSRLVIAPERGLRAVDGLLTGWHEPRASHLQILEAVAGEELLARSYEAALERGYLWHEFGDSHLILP